MTKITTDFVGNETTAVTKSRLTSILAYWGASTAAYTTWGQARTALNALLTSTTAGTIGSTELAGSFLPKINFLNDPDDMIADALFGAGEQGVWLDPSDVANVAWRRNILTWTQDFDNPAWVKSGTLPVVTANAATAPDGTMTADLVLFNRGAGNTLSDISGLALSPIAEAGTYTGTLYFKAATSGDIGKQIAYRHVAGSSYTVVTLTGDWVRVSRTDVRAANNFDIVNRGTITADNSVSVLLWGAQLELGSTATGYQRITDLNTEVIERFPNATMYQDAAGTTAVYAPGQPVGLRLDKSKGLVLGSEKVANGNFASGATGWTIGNASWSVTAGVMANSGSNAGVAANVQQASVITSGKTYRITFDFTCTSGSLNLWLAGSQLVQAGITAPGTKVFTVTATVSGSIFLEAAPGAVVSIDNVSVKELAGNHASQATLASRPLYGIEPKGGRRNLLIYSQEFDNAIWGRTASVTVSANYDTAPDGTVTADRFVSTGGAFPQIAAAATLIAGQPYTFSAWVKSDGTSQIAQALLLEGAVTAFTPTSTWTRVSVTVPSSAGGSRTAVFATNSGTAAASSFVFWGAQLELGSTVTNYQRVTTAFDVTEAGVNTCHYCQYDGSDDGMVTNSIDFTATDKMSVFAGVRKNNNGESSILELSAAWFSNNGTFSLQSSLGFAANYYFGSYGTAFGEVTSPSSFNAPINNVVTALGDISGDRATLRANGTQVGQATTNQGTGNYGNYPLYIGRRGGAGAGFNGRDYGIIITGKLANATAIATTEMWLANKTSGVTL